MSATPKLPGRGDILDATAFMVGCTAATVLGVTVIGDEIGQPTPMRIWSFDHPLAAVVIGAALGLALAWSLIRLTRRGT